MLLVHVNYVTIRKLIALLFTNLLIERKLIFVRFFTCNNHLNLPILCLLPTISILIF